MDNHLAKFRVSSYASRYWYAHIREGRLEEEFCQETVETFENQCARDFVFQILQYTLKKFYWFNFESPRLHLLHIAAMHGLCTLCGEVLRQSNTMQRMYFLILKPLILEKCPWRRCI